MSKKVDHVAYGLDDATPSNINEALDKRKEMWGDHIGGMKMIKIMVAIQTIAVVGTCIAVLMTIL